jgi:N-acetylneuraminic acid mutarotase
MKSRAFLFVGMASLVLCGCGGSKKVTVPGQNIGNEWTWVKGAGIANQQGVYGTLGRTADANLPGARSNATGRADSNGNFWLFGGQGIYTGTSIPLFNDLWKYNAGQWTWISGSNAVNQFGMYGSEGTAAAGNVPGARSGAAGGIDAAGTLWLFGGNGYDSAGTSAILNDLWKYSSGMWTWVGGSNLVDQPGIYGSMGTAAASKVPGAREYAASWIDTKGSFWIFGGFGKDSTGANGFLNDMWKYSAGQWTWMGGANVGNQQGTYGKQGSASPNNAPGARSFASDCVDQAGTFWLFGGEDNVGFYNDLWKYSAGEWTWISGSSAVNLNGRYGSQGTAASINIPGGRSNAVCWIDQAGNLWLFGGYGYDSTGANGLLNDMWKFSAGKWTWIGGSSAANAPGTHGNLGTAAPDNIPAARSAAVGWADKSGNLWLFGGAGPLPSAGGTSQEFSDLWKYKP